MLVTLLCVWLFVNQPKKQTKKFSKSTNFCKSAIDGSFSNQPIVVKVAQKPFIFQINHSHSVDYLQFKCKQSNPTSTNYLYISMDSHSFKCRLFVSKSGYRLKKYMPLRTQSSNKEMKIYCDNKIIRKNVICIHVKPADRFFM